LGNLGILGAAAIPTGRKRHQAEQKLHATGPKFQQALATLTLGLTALALWALTHEYRGLVLDGQIYAVQALAKLRPALNSDLFLANTTQDQFTIFSRVYAWVIGAIGLNPAAMLLTGLFSFWFLYATWILTASLFDADYAWLGVFLILITGGHYGAFAVFHFLEPFLTARLPAEALVVTALALTARGWIRAGLATAIAAMFFHPLMALPGLLLLICLRMPLRTSMVGAAGGIAACLLGAIVAAKVPAAEQWLPPMDGTWLYVVRERSQFLFLPLWTIKDWELNVRPFVCLALTAMVIDDERVRKLALSAMLVGVAGLAVAGIASLAGPAVLIQGQAWRWVWITSLVSVAFLLPTARALWTRAPCGRACALALVAAWSFPAYIGFLFAVAAAGIWMVRENSWLQAARHIHWMMVLIGIAIVALAVAETAHVIDSAKITGTNFSMASVGRTIATLRIWLIAVAVCVFAWVKLDKSALTPLFISGVVGAAGALLLYQSLLHSRSFGSPANINEFADWRQAIPPKSTVFVTNGHDSGSFVWFTLQRNNYLSPGQSAGVVFSRATALEVKRRSEVLLPLVNESWKVLTLLQRSKSVGDSKAASYHNALTKDSLVRVCTDTALGFVISPDAVGFNPIVHTGADAYQNWKLYDCDRVRMQSNSL
jgi:hypothetical protein